LRAAVLLVVACVAGGPAAAVDEGATLFEARCGACHALDAAAPEGAGPNLAGLIGRTLAGDPRFDYSPALRAARATGQTWSAELLDRFLAEPDDMFPGLWMGGNGVPDAAVRAAVVDWLKRH
jgi:cytochrome c